MSLGRSHTQTATAPPRKPPARSSTTETPTAPPRKPPARSAPAGHAALLASLRSAAVLAVPGFADRAGPFHSHPVGWTDRGFLSAGRAGGSCRLDGQGTPATAGSHPLPSRLRAGRRSLAGTHARYTSTGRRSCSLRCAGCDFRALVRFAHEDSRAFLARATAPAQLLESAPPENGLRTLPDDPLASPRWELLPAGPERQRLPAVRPPVRP